MNYWKDYLYAHDYPGNFVTQEYLPEEIKGTNFYRPGNNPRENEMRNRLSQYWKNKYNF